MSRSIVKLRRSPNPLLLLPAAIGLALGCAGYRPVAAFVKQEGCYEKRLACDQPAGLFRSVNSETAQVLLALSPLAELERASEGGSCLDNSSWAAAQIGTLTELREGSLWSGPVELLRNNPHQGQEWLAQSTALEKGCATWRVVTSRNHTRLVIAVELRCEGRPTSTLSVEEWVIGRGLVRLTAFGSCLFEFRPSKCPDKWWESFISRLWE